MMKRLQKRTNELTMRYLDEGEAQRREDIKKVLRMRTLAQRDRCWRPGGSALQERRASMQCWMLLLNFLLAPNEVKAIRGGSRTK